MTEEGRCWWCDEPLVPPKRKFHTEACRQKYKRAEEAASWADLVQRLGPYVKVAGTSIYQEMVDRLARRVNEPV